jgi:hypothetical protein
VEEMDRKAREDKLKLPNIEDWLENRVKIPQKISKSSDSFTYPHPSQCDSLPPSLMPITREQIMNATFSEWG